MVVRTKVSAEPAAPAEPPRSDRLPRGRRADLLLGGAAALLTLLLAGVLLRVWRADLDIPFSYRGETQYYLMLAKTMDDHGGILENPSLGAPFGLDLHDYAVGSDRLSLELIRVLSLVGGGPVEGVNLFFLLTFPLAAVAAFLVLRLLGLGRLSSAVCSVLFAVMPYHFARGEDHLFLSAYFAVPLGLYLVLTTLGGRRLIGRPLLSGQTLLTVAFCVVVGSSGIYYAAFTLLLLAAAIALGALARVDRAALLGGGVALGLILLVVGLNVAGTLAYRSDRGPNAAVTRPVAEAEQFALKFTDLVLPPEGSRLGPLSRVTADYRTATPIRSEAGQSLGLVGAAGFVALLAVALLALLGRRSTGPPVVGRAAAVAILAFVLGTVGGASVLVAQLLTPQIRGWNRISILIAFLALIAVAAALDWLGRRRSRGVFAAALGATLAVGVYSQATTTGVPPYELAGAWRQDQAFVREVERRLPRGASVFVLPYVAFPETGQVFELSENDLLRGYLHSDDLRWSFGAMKGRVEDWSQELSALPVPTVLDGAVAAGFSGLYIDRFGYADRAAALESEIASRLGAQPFVAESGRHSFFDLTGLRKRLEAKHGNARVAELREAVIRPFHLVPSGFMPLLRSGPYLAAWADSAEAELRIVNNSSTTRTATFEATLDRIGGEPADVTVTFPGAPPRTVRSPALLRQELTLPPGESVVRFSTGAAPVEASRSNEARRHYFKLANLAITDAGFRGFR